METTTKTTTKKVAVDEYAKQFTLLKESHEKHFFGVPNKDQKEQKNGFVTFNYIDKAEMYIAKQAFKKVGIDSYEREGKNFNLVFMLDFKRILNSKIKRVERNFENDKVLSLVIWLLKKVYRKTIHVEPTIGTQVVGISQVGSLKSTLLEFESIRKDIEKKYDIVCLARPGKGKFVDFFVLYSEEAKLLHCTHNYKLPISGLVHLLSDEVQIQKLREGLKAVGIQKVNINKKNQKTKIKKIQRMAKTNGRNFLALEVRKSLRQFNVCPIRSPKTKGQFFVATTNDQSDIKKIRVSFTNGTPEQVLAAMTIAKRDFNQKYLDKVTMVDMSPATFSISIDGFENQKVVVKERKEKATVAKKERTVSLEHLMDIFKELPDDAKQKALGFLDLLKTANAAADVSAIVESIAKDFFFIEKAKGKVMRAHFYTAPKIITKLLLKKKK